jgi:hypothetical protein
MELGDPSCKIESRVLVLVMVWEITSSIATWNESTSSGTFLSSSINFDPVTTTVQRPNSGTLKMECRYYMVRVKIS